MIEPPFALISDIHANLEALEAVLAHIDNSGVKSIVGLGDAVGYGPDPDKVIDLLIRRGVTSVAGNHDWAVVNKPHGFNALAREVIDHQRDMLEPKFYHLVGKTRERWSWLENLPPHLEIGDLQFVHGSLRDPLMDYCFGDRHRLFKPEQIDQILPMVAWICFAGHTHFPVVIREDKVCWYPSEAGWLYPLEKGHKYIINVGSVGQPRDHDPRACYAVFSGASITYHRVLYDVETTRRKILAISETEKPLADRLVQGR